MKRYGLMLSCEEYKEYDGICYCHSNADSDDTVMFYFAGHGMKIESEGFLILPNTKKSDIAKTAIELKKLNEIMLNKKCNCFIILDACHSGLSPRGEQISLFVETLSDKR